MGSKDSLSFSRDHATVPYPESDQTTPYNPPYLTTALILSSNIGLGIPDFPAKILYAFNIAPIRAPGHAQRTLLCLIT